MQAMSQTKNQERKIYLRRFRPRPWAPWGEWDECTKEECRHSTLTAYYEGKEACEEGMVKTIKEPNGN